ncbi:MAG TPA: DUF2393 family protein [Terracidiphilus sp.]|nr:DUF2393 family protein [Terracidiphilus sp.]
MSTGQNLNLVPRNEARQRNWVPLAIAAFVVIVVAALVILVMQHSHKTAIVTSISATPDPYAANLPITNLAMSESSNFVGGKLTYVDGHITNTGDRVVKGITVQVLFRDFAKEVTQNVTQKMMLIRTREPYIDVEPISAAPLQPGGERDFRLIFDAVSPDWDGAYPEIRIVHVDFH